jgi:mRNA interferase RelE/StbE
VRLFFTDPALKDLAGLDPPIRDLVHKALDRLLTHPESAELGKVKRKPGTWRLRVGDWRILLEPHWTEKIIYVMRIEHRRQVYR